MCGIMGFINKNKGGHLTDIQRENIMALVEGISDRGLDASGVAVWHSFKVDKNGNYDVSLFKWPQSSMELAISRYLREILRKPVVAMIGHARAATHGAPINNMHNHPFVSRRGTVFLVHNGIVWDEGKKAVEDLLLGECDTEILIRHIEKFGIKEAFNKAADWHLPSYAVLMLYPPTKKFYFIRRDNPVYIRNTITSLYVASTKEIMEYAIGTVHTQLDIRPKENNLLMYSVEEFQKEGMNVSEDPYLVANIPAATRSYTYTGVKGGSSYTNYGGYYG